MKTLAAVLLAALCACRHAPPRQAGSSEGTRWLFKGGLVPPERGPARLHWRGPAARAADGDLEIPPGEGLRLVHGAAPNGAGARQGRLSNYTIVLDAYFPPSAKRFRALLQTDPGNRDDADLFLRADGALGISALYHGRVSTGAWHRVAVQVQCASGSGGTGHIMKFVDGRFVGAQQTDVPSADGSCRWSAGPELLLFADEDGQTDAVRLRSMLFEPRLLGFDALEALGGPHPDGAWVPGAAAPPEAPLPRAIGVIGHRGDSCCAPENTVASVRQAFDKGADMVEIDVRRSADGVAVLAHDETLERVTDGTGRVSARSLRQLRKLDAGSWFDPAFAGERPPALSEALKAALGRGSVLLDVKDPGMGDAIARAMAESGLPATRVALYCASDLDRVARWREQVPGTRLIWGAHVPAGDAAAWDRLAAAGVSGFDVDLSTGDASFIKEAHRRGMTVWGFTANDPETMRRAAALGYDALETDYPAVLRRLRP